MISTVRHFKKYANRKFYDLDKGHYISLLDLAEVVVGGDEVEVICDRTSRDLTFETLTRALYERTKAYFASSRFPLDNPIAPIAVMRIIRLIPPSIKSSMKGSSK